MHMVLKARSDAGMVLHSAGGEVKAYSADDGKLPMESCDRTACRGQE